MPFASHLALHCIRLNNGSSITCCHTGVTHAADAEGGCYSRQQHRARPAEACRACEASTCVLQVQQMAVGNTAGAQVKRYHGCCSAVLTGLHQYICCRREHNPAGESKRSWVPAIPSIGDTCTACQRYLQPANSYTAAALTQQMVSRALSGVPAVTTPLGLRVPLRHPYWICAQVKDWTVGGGLGLGDGGLRNPLSETLLYVMAAK
jgi:hypothetical protein